MCDYVPMRRSTIESWHAYKIYLACGIELNEKKKRFHMIHVTFGSFVCRRLVDGLLICNVDSSFDLNCGIAFLIDIVDLIAIHGPCSYGEI